MLSPKDKRKIRQLQKDGYLSDSNPLTGAVMAAVRGATEPRQEWLEAFLTLAHDGAESEDDNPAIAEEWKVDNATDDNDAVFKLMGRSDKRQRSLRNSAVIRQWIRNGLNAPTTLIGQLCDVSHQYASSVREEWGDEIRALLQEAACLHLSGEDLYYACDPTLSVPTRLIERLKELREARGTKGGMLRREFDTWLKNQWFEYRQRNPSKWDTDHPPRWFLRQISEET